MNEFFVRSTMIGLADYCMHYNIKCILLSADYTPTGISYMFSVGMYGEDATRLMLMFPDLKIIKQNS